MLDAGALLRVDGGVLVSRTHRGMEPAEDKKALGIEETPFLGSLSSRGRRRDGAHYTPIHASLWVRVGV